MTGMHVKIQILLLALHVLFTCCERPEPDTSFTVHTEEIGVSPDFIYTFNGLIINPGNKELVNVGFCWSELQEPDINDSLIKMGAENLTGAFSYIIYNLPARTTFYVKAFASDGISIYYGEEKVFVTPDTVPFILTDVENNLYRTVKIGEQIWMADNLKTTRYSDGITIQCVEDRQAWYDFSLYASAYCWYDNYSAIGAIYGALYTWPAAMRVNYGDIIEPDHQGICPVGWHIPGDDEWKELEIYLGMGFSDADDEDWRGTDEGGRLKDTGFVHWESPNEGATNQARFNALPSGWRDGAGYFKNLGTGTRFWTSSTRGDYAWSRELATDNSRIFRGTKGFYSGHSVRCVKNQ